MDMEYNLVRIVSSFIHNPKKKGYQERFTDDFDLASTAILGGLCRPDFNDVLLVRTCRSYYGLHEQRA
jgi:hypothetical protein